MRELRGELVRFNHRLVGLAGLRKALATHPGPETAGGLVDLRPAIRRSSRYTWSSATAASVACRSTTSTGPSPSSCSRAPDERTQRVTLLRWLDPAGVIVDDLADVMSYVGKNVTGGGGRGRAGKKHVSDEVEAVEIDHQHGHEDETIIDSIMDSIEQDSDDYDYDGGGARLLEVIIEREGVASGGRASPDDATGTIQLPTDPGGGLPAQLARMPTACCLASRIRRPTRGRRT